MAVSNRESRSSYDLGKLSETGCIAYAVRRAMRVLPEIIERDLSLVWGRESANQMEALLFGIKATLVVCTNESKLDGKEATKIAAAVSLAANEVDRAKDEYSSNAEASYGHGDDYGGDLDYGASASAGRLSQIIRTVEIAVTAASANCSNESVSEVIELKGLEPRTASERADFESLREYKSNTFIPLSFFKKPLWSSQIPDTWKVDIINLKSLIQKLHLVESGIQFENWIKGEFDPLKMLQQVSDSVGKIGLFSEETKRPRAAEEAGSETNNSSQPEGEESRGRESQSLGSDSAKTLDHLNREPLARIIAEFVSNENTKPPIALSIEGPWGSGKSSLMHFLKRQLKGKIPVVEFNPWRISNHEELWATFALTVLSKAKEEAFDGKTWFERLKIQWNFERTFVDRNSLWIDAIKALAKLTVIVIPASILAGLFSVMLVQAGTISEPENWWNWLAYLGLTPVTIAALLASVKVGSWLRKNHKGLFIGKIEAQMNRPDYESRASFLSDFHDDFNKALGCYLPDTGRIVVLIDDLDRCDVPRAAELMQGINLMLGDTAPLVYVLGLDRAKVAAGIAVKHENLLPYLYAQQLVNDNVATNKKALAETGIQYGYEFIEKFIQVPISLPRAETKDVKEFVRKRLVLEEKDQSRDSEMTTGSGGEKDSKVLPGSGDVSSGSIEFNAVKENKYYDDAETNKRGIETTSDYDEKSGTIRTDESHLVDPIVTASRVLKGNPRRIAQLVNLTRFQRLVAEAYGMNSISDEVLAKWTAVSLQWPRFIVDLEDDNDLRIFLRGIGENEPPKSANNWVNQIDFLQKEGDDGTAPSASIRHEDTLDQLLFLSLTVPVAETQIYSDPEGDIYK